MNLNLTVKIASQDEIFSSQRIWNSLVQSMHFPSVFLTWEWMTTWIKHFGKSYNICVIYVFKDSKLVAILPLAVKKTRLPNSFFKSRILAICGSLELFPDHLDLICHRNDNAIFYLKKILDFLTNKYNDWDALYLTSLSCEGNLAKYLSESDLRLKVISEDSILSPYISLDKDPISFLGSMKRKKRYNLNREKKILFDKNDVNLVKVTDEEDLKWGMDELFELHSARAIDRGIQSTFSDKAIYDFHAELSHKFIKLGWLRLYFLKTGNKFIASAYGFIFNDCFYFFQTGMDPEWKKLSPGKVLIFSILQDIKDDNVVEFDFLEGDETYKSFWTKNSRELLSYKIFNSHFISSMEFITLKLRSYLKAIFIKFPVLGKIRTAFNAN